MKAKNVNAFSGRRWYYRLTANQEALLVKAIGPIKDLDYRVAITKVKAVKQFGHDIPVLVKTITEAAEKAGDTGRPPLVDRLLIDTFYQSR